MSGLTCGCGNEIEAIYCDGCSTVRALVDKKCGCPPEEDMFFCSECSKVRFSELEEEFEEHLEKSSPHLSGMYIKLERRRETYLQIKRREDIANKW